MNQCPLNGQKKTDIGDPGVLAKDPGGQAVQAVEPVLEKEPIGHGTQSENLEAPKDGLFVPAKKKDRLLC